MIRIDSSYKLIDFLTGRRSSADAVVNVATVEFSFGSYFGTHGHIIDLFLTIVD